jgi:type III secretion system FlhB-like substrate exporter
MRKVAVALRGGMPWSPGAGTRAEAPIVAASGRGHLADEIVALAGLNGVPIERDPALAMALSHLEVGQAIPPALYTAIAELLVFLYELDARQAGGETMTGVVMGSDPDAPLSALL